MPKNEIKYLTAIKQEKRPKKYCRFKKFGIRYIDYKDAEFLKKFLNEQGRLLPRRITGNSLKYQRKVAQDVNNLGGTNEVVNVKNGYARNFLFPRQMAIEASPSNMKQLEERLKQQKK